MAPPMNTREESTTACSGVSIWAFSSISEKQRICLAVCVLLHCVRCHSLFNRLHRLCRRGRCQLLLLMFRGLLSAWMLFSFLECWEEQLQTERVERVKKIKELWESLCRAFVGI